MMIKTIVQRAIKWRFHNAFTIVVTLLQPMLWLVLYGVVANQSMQASGIEQYTAFILPGLIVLLCFGTCSSSGMMNYLMKRDGSFYRILIAPVNRSSIVLGHLIEAVLCSYLEVGFMILVSFFLGVRLPLDVPLLLCMLLLISLTAFFMAGITYGISLLLPNEVVYETIMNAIVLPVFFLSSALFPADNLTGVFGVLVQWNPFTHMINALRSLMIAQELPSHDLSFVLLLFLVLACLSFTFAHIRLKKETMQ